MTMSETVSALAARLLKEASTQFQDNGCNDLPDDLFEGIDEGERIVIIREFHKWLDPENAPDMDINYLGPDWAWMEFLASKLEKTDE